MTSVSMTHLADLRRRRGTILLVEKSSRRRSPPVLRLDWVKDRFSVSRMVEVDDVILEMARIDDSTVVEDAGGEPWLADCFSSNLQVYFLPDLNLRQSR